MPVDFKQIPTNPVTEGPFHFSRNPMYLGGVVVLLGLAVVLGSLVTFFFPAFLFLLLQFFYIPTEEAHMEVLFGMEYMEYKQRVRRWV